MTRYLAVVGIGVLVACVASLFLLTGPHMYVQPHIRTYEAVMPPTPQGAVPVEPVLGYTVLPEHRWYLVVYTRELAEEGSKFKVQGER